MEAYFKESWILQFLSDRFSSDVVGCLLVACWAVSEDLPAYPRQCIDHADQFGADFEDSWVAVLLRAIHCDSPILEVDVDPFKFTCFTYSHRSLLE